MAYIACSPQLESPRSAFSSPISPNVAQQLDELRQHVQFLNSKLQEAVESRDYYANLYYCTKQKLETTRSSLHYAMQHLKFISNQANTVVSQIEGDGWQKHKSSLTSTPIKRHLSVSAVPSDSIPSKDMTTSRQTNTRKTSHSQVVNSAFDLSPTSTARTNYLSSRSKSLSDESSQSPNLEYKSYKAITPSEFSDLRQQISDPNCTFSYLQLSNCRMGSVEVMEAFCCDLAKNTSLIELSLTNVGVKLDSLAVLLKCLSTMVNIRVLRLQYNKIGEECFNVLKAFMMNTHLMFLDLKGNPIENSDSKTELERLCSHPGRCTIRFHDSKPATSGNTSNRNAEDVTEL